MRDFLKFFSRKEEAPSRVDLVTSRRKKRYSSTAGLDDDWHMYDTRSGFYRYLRNRIPIISSAIWNWVRLCNTPGSYHITGNDSHRREAESVIEMLLHRLCGVDGVKRSGPGSLLEKFFLEVFTNGAYSGRLVPLASGRGIDYFEEFDPDMLKWRKHGRWFPELKSGESFVRLDPELFFHYGLGSDRFSPRGVSFLSSVEFVTVIEQRMLEDMALSSHNVGNPHLHVKITPPERMENESDSQYIKRAEKYFDDTSDMFRKIDPDDNIFSWSDLEVDVIGGDKSMSSSWRINREQVIEDVITGMKLFPWVVGRSHGTTKNWVQAQYNLLMQVVDSIQEEGKALAEWILNKELEFRGIPASAEYIFSPNQDPYQLEREKANSLRFDTIDKKVSRGYISKVDGARELGYSEPHLS